MPEAKNSSTFFSSLGMNTLEKSLGTFEPIGLEQIQTHALMNRVDTKYVCETDQLVLLLNKVRNDYRVLCIEDELIPKYASIYFDTADQECYLKHHNNRKSRQKVRIRQYQSTGTTFLEVKCKNNKGRTHKSRMEIAQISDKLSVEQQEFVSDILNRSINWLPALQTNFRRITLVNKHCSERVTIDLNLSFSKEESSVALPQIAIVEVKQELNNRQTKLRAELKQMRIRPFRFSKYCLGSSLLSPELKNNRFKGRLRKIYHHAEAE